MPNSSGGAIKLRSLRGGAQMQPHTRHSHTRVVLHLGSHTFVSLLRSRKAVGVRKKTGLLFAWMILGILLVGCLSSDAR